MRPLGARDGARAADARTHARARARRGCGGRGARARIQLAAGRPRTFSSSAPDAMAFSCSQSLGASPRGPSEQRACELPCPQYCLQPSWYITHIIYCAFHVRGCKRSDSAARLVFRDASTSRRAGSRAGRRRRRTWTSVTGTVSTNVSGVFSRRRRHGLP